MHDNDTVIEEVLRSGAQGYLVKGSPGSMLLEAMTALADHRSYFSENVEAKLIDKLAHDQLDPCNCLSNRERSVVQLIAEAIRASELLDCWKLL
jgi:DNA-binding NarL/FixJ family response regulator